MRCLAFSAMLAWSFAAAAHPHSASECREGGDFIRNAAIARDSGATREFFVGRLEDDLMVIRSFPAPLRWFAQDPGDESFLRAEVAEVFDAPQGSDAHRNGFVERCVQRSERLAAAGG